MSFMIRGTFRTKSSRFFPQFFLSDSTVQIVPFFNKTGQNRSRIYLLQFRQYFLSDSTVRQVGGDFSRILLRFSSSTRMVKFTKNTVKITNTNVKL